MPLKGEQTRKNIIDKTAHLMQTKGYHATGLNQIIRESGAPKGSLYFHFPGGKEEIAAAAVKACGDEMALLLQSIFKETDNFLTALNIVIDYLKEELIQSGFIKGCPVATVALEAAPHYEKMQVVCNDVYRQWVNIITKPLVKTGIALKEAEKRAVFLLSAIEGAMILCKSSQSITPLEHVRELSALLIQNSKT
jgi:TetR/AcrR family transcriptional repressor of lmrAB and yxaGH operons